MNSRTAIQFFCDGVVLCACHAELPRTGAEGFGIRGEIPAGSGGIFLFASGCKSGWADGPRMAARDRNALKVPS